MAKHDFRYFFHEGLSNMFSHGFHVLCRHRITVACLLIMGTFTLVAVNANALLRTLEQENEILAYVDDSYTETEARALKQTLEAIPNVASATFISKEEAMESFTAQYPDEALFQDLDPEILRDRFAIKVVDLEQQSATVEQVKAVEGIAKVNAYEEIAGGFITVRNVAHGGVRGPDRHFVCGLCVHHFQHHQAHHLRPAGGDRHHAPWWALPTALSCWPFVYEGFLFGLIGAAVAFLLQWGLYSAVAKGVANNDTLQLIQIIPFTEMWLPVAGTFAAAGIVIGVGGSLSAIRKFLQV